MWEDATFGPDLRFLEYDVKVAQTRYKGEDPDLPRTGDFVQVQLLRPVLCCPRSAPTVPARSGPHRIVTSAGAGGVHDGVLPRQRGVPEQRCVWGVVGTVRGR